MNLYDILPLVLVIAFAQDRGFLKPMYIQLNKQPIEKWIFVEA